jgi:hypothetical protein
MDYDNNGEIHLDFDRPVRMGGKSIVYVIFGKEYKMDAITFRTVLGKGLSVSGRESDYIRVVESNKK